MRDIIYIVVAGGFGALGRYFITGLAHRLFGAGFPYGTLIVNVLGSFLIGLVMQASMSTDLVPPSWRLALTLGFLGAFTTFSAFSYETLGYLEDGAWLLAGVNILANVLPAIIAVFFGVLLGRTLFGGV
ncbi:MAG: fluoride efflux transporter CrcB [Dehalococcoidales bacterium]|nr:fluoride efflux transporter CrcB [Dehalococcoidales bacterium]